MSTARSESIELKATVHRYKFLVLTLVVGAVGALLILYHRNLPSPEVSRDFGIALFAAGTVGVAVELLTRRQFRELVNDELSSAVNNSLLGRKLDEVLARGSLGGDLRELGVRRIHADRNAINFLDVIDDADPGTELRFLGVCLAGFVGRNTQVHLEKKLREKCRIRLLIIDPACDAVRWRAAEEDRAPETVKREIEGADEIHDSFVQTHVSQEYRGQIQLGHYNSQPSYFIVSTNKTMIVGFYLRGGLGEFFPQLELEIKAGGIHEAFSRHFELLWESRHEAAATVKDPVMPIASAQVQPAG